MKRLRLKPYIDQIWPEHKQAVLAQYDAEAVVLYTAVRRKAMPAVMESGDLPPAAEGMRWMSTFFLAIMHRSAWGTAPNQNAVIALWVRRAAFDALLAQAVPTRFEPGQGGANGYTDKDAWRAALSESGVRAQWDALRAPEGDKLQRRALLLGLAPGPLAEISAATLQLENISEYVKQQAEYADDAAFVLMPTEKLYPVEDESTAARLGIEKTST